MSSIHVLRHDQPTGPFSEEEIRAQLAQGSLTPADYAWREGMADWQPLSAVVALPTAPPPAPGHAPVRTAPPPRRRPAPKRRVPPSFVMTGTTEFLEVFPDRLVITPKGGLGLKAKKDAPGIRQLPVLTVLSIGYKLPNFTNGYFQITAAGETGEILFRFDKTAENTDAAGRITAFVQERIHEARSIPTTMSAASLSEEIAKLAALHNQGALSVAEFQAAKQRLLS